MTLNEHMDYFEDAKIELSSAKLRFKTIPDLGFIDALSETTKGLKLHFPLDKALGDIVELGEVSWSFDIRAARLKSDLLNEYYVQIENVSNIRHLVIELDASHVEFSLHPDHISNWQQALANFTKLKSLKFVLKLSRGKGGKQKKQKLDPTISDLKSYFKYPNGKTPEAVIEVG